MRPFNSNFLSGDWARNVQKVRSFHKLPCSRDSLDQQTTPAASPPPCPAGSAPSAHPDCCHPPSAQPNGCLPSLQNQLSGTAGNRNTLLDAISVCMCVKLKEIDMTVCQSIALFINLCVQYYFYWQVKQGTWYS